MLSKDNFYTLRNSVVINSVFLKDYQNTLFIKPETVCAFFDDAIEYINNEYKERNNKDIER